MEIYQWIFRRNGFTVSNIAYFVYCNGKTDCTSFDAKLEFDIKLIPYEGNDSWVEPAIINAHQTLMNDQPPPAKNCDWCAYFEARADSQKKTDISP